MIVSKLKRVAHDIFLIISNRKSLSMSYKQPLSSKTNMITDKSSTIRVGAKTSTFGNADISSIAGGKLDIGNDVAFNRNIIVVCRNRIVIGNNVIFGPNVVIYDHDHVFGTNGIEPAIYTKDEVIIEDGCWIGANVTILKGTHIGKGSVIGAGTVIKGTIPERSLVTNDRTLRVKPIRDR